MSSLRTTIESLASEFAASVLDALRSASLDELADVAGRGAPTRRGPGRPRADAGESAGAAPKRLGRRSAGDITRMIQSIVDVLQKSASGLRAEQIRETLGVEAKELPRPLADAISSGRITKSGQKRATTYFVGASGAAAAAGGKRRGRPAGKKTAKRR